jgi:glycerophosphoryl diester phosphodiesterase
MLLDDLATLMAVAGAHEDAILQLDYKQDARALDAAAIGNFARAVAPVARHMILSSGDAEAVRMLTGAAPDIRVGYDPCHEGALDTLAASKDYAGFVARAVAASPRAEMIYLAYPMILAVLDHGFDMIGAFHAAGRTVDAYTVKAVNAETVRDVGRLLAQKVDQITTDDPEGLGKAVG